MRAFTRSEINYSREAIKILMIATDMTQIVGGRGGVSPKKTTLSKVNPAPENLALELLSGCGMISEVRRRISPNDEPRRRPLSQRVHHSSVSRYNV